MPTIYKMAHLPDQESYSVVRGSNLQTQESEGGAIRIRRKSRNAPHTLTVQWTGDNKLLDYLMAFYNLWEIGDSYFLADLIIDRSELLEYKCDFVPDSFKYSGTGFKFTVSAQLLVRAENRHNDEDEIILLGVLDWEDVLERIVDNTLPRFTNGLK